MKINQEGIELIQCFEGLRLEAYQDMAGIWTIGYGCTGKIKPGTRITKADAISLLMGRLRHLEAEISSVIRVPVNENEFSALCCLAYNIGFQALKVSSLFEKLSQGAKDLAADEFLKWCKVDGKEVKGLLKRRKAERDLFLKPIH